MTPWILIRERERRGRSKIATLLMRNKRGKRKKKR
jgi:hypothetical protein